MRIIIKILIYFLLFLTGLVLTLLILTQTQWFKAKLVDFGESRLESVFNGRLTIGKLEGNLFKTIIIKDITYLDSTGKNIISIEEIGLTYRIKELFSKSIYADNLSISKTKVHLAKSDSVWNISTMLKKRKGKKEKKPFQWKITVNNAKISEFESFVSSPDSSLPESLKIGLNFYFLLGGKNLTINMDRFHLIMQGPDLQVKNGRAFFKKEDRLLRIKDLQLETEHSFVHLTAFLSSKDFEKGSLDLKSKVSFQELGYFVKGLNKNASPEVNVQAVVDQGNLDADIIVLENDQTVSGKVRLMGLLKEISLNTKLDLKHLDISGWIDNDKLTSNLSGGLDIESNSLDFKSSNVKGEFFLANTPVQGIDLDSLYLKFDKKGDKIQSDFLLITNENKGNFSVSINRLYDEPDYKIFGELRQLNLGKILNNDKLISELDMDFNLTGSGKTLKTARLDFSTDIKKAVYGDFGIENALIRIQYDKGSYVIQDFSVQSTLADLSLTGQGVLKDSLRLDLIMQVKDLSTLRHLWKGKKILTTGTINAQISGNIDSLSTKLQFDLSKSIVDTLNIDKLAGNLAVNIVPEKKHYDGNVEISASNLLYGKYKLETFRLNSDFSEKQYNNRIYFESKDSLDGNLGIDINVVDDPLITLKNLDVNVFGHHWTGGSDSSEVQLFKDRITVRKIDFASENQRITIDGHYSFKGKEDLIVDIKNIRIDKLPFVEKVLGQPKGILNLDLDLKGTASQPEIIGDLRITNGSISGISIDSLLFDLNYGSNQMNFTSSLTANHTHIVTVSAEVPYHISFADSIQKIDKNIPLKVSLKTDSLDLNLINSILDNNEFEVSGTLIGDFKLDGSVANPVISGFLNLHDGNLKLKKLGINYHDAVLKSEFRDSKFVLDTFRILSGKKGELNISGETKLGSTFNKPIDKFSVKIVGKDFVLTKSSLTDIEFNTDLDMQGTLDDPEFNGILNIEKAKLNIDELMKRGSNRAKKIGTPMLVEALSDTVDVLAKKDTITFTVDSTEFETNGFMENLHGVLTVDLPGNVWIRGNDMNVQLEGKLKVTKNKWDIRYFGDIEAKRGYYKLYGRKLVIDKATAKLRGEEKINPILNLHVYYKFRVKNKNGNDNLKMLNIAVSGTLSEPLVNFDLDGKGIEKEDAISYLLFGMKMNDLDFSQQSQIPASTENIAKDVGFSQLANILQSSIGQSIGIDVIEIESNDNWETAPVTLGKYITNYLYMSYTYTFSLTNEKKDFEPYKLVLEYQILRNLFLQGSNSGRDSGFDVFLKFDF